MVEGVRPAPRGTKLATYINILDIFGVCRFYLLFSAAKKNICCADNRCKKKFSHFVRLFAYRSNKITFFANRICRLVILWKKRKFEGAANANSIFCRTYRSNKITTLVLSCCTIPTLDTQLELERSPTTIPQITRQMHPPPPSVAGVVVKVYFVTKH